nr:TPA_asm: hypothetical protein HUJ06_019554 [Nelumbo nucifera]
MLRLMNGKIKKEKIKIKDILGPPLPSFQRRYRVESFNLLSGNGRLTLRELKRGNLIAAMQHANEEEDINKVLR